jgi:beta-glucosidase
VLSFPKDFLFGAATSSHQVEGDNRNNDWWSWEQVPGHIHDGTTSGRACQWWEGRAEEDLRRAAEMGHRAHRMSLEWSRLEPEPGRWDDAAFNRYRAILTAGRQAGLTMAVTVNHFTLPQWIAARGSWLDGDRTARGIVARFETLCGTVARRLGDRVDLWITMNEPSILAYLGYAGTEWPPGLGRPNTAFVALARMLMAHAKGYAAIHRERPNARVGLVHNAPLFEPSRELLIDRALARLQDWSITGVVLRALKSGWLMPPLTLRPRRVPGLESSLDFMGLNFYGRYQVRFDPRAKDDFFGAHVQPSTIATAHTDWGQPWPKGLRQQLHRLSSLGVPLYVTENGVYDNEDRLRPQLLADYLREVHRAIEEGVDVRGYFLWSLLDNFEWAEGWATHFGLLELDRQTGERRPRPSADRYARICKEGGIPEDWG